MEWTMDEMDRLYGLYERHIDRLHRDVIAANRSLGSSKPEQTGLHCVSRAEFESLLGHGPGNPETIQLWVQRIIRGHEHEFPRFEAQRNLIRGHCADTGPKPSQTRRRSTGT